MLDHHSNKLFLLLLIYLKLLQPGILSQR